ncbi:hypothetical protein CEXT_401801 [Caerostris extrusa]|uniref:Uncharacterized protein n=1 Tax=Caerostris extrusa TaxID=172846 RepID=A0AAV4MUH9_CAEEX|nr:hypothetical protein CEXT_401801 [Caerostris extrusa]
MNVRERSGRFEQRNWKSTAVLRTTMSASHNIPKLGAFLCPIKADVFPIYVANSPVTSLTTCLCSVATNDSNNFSETRVLKLPVPLLQPLWLQHNRFRHSGRRKVRASRLVS